MNDNTFHRSLWAAATLTIFACGGSEEGADTYFTSDLLPASAQAAPIDGSLPLTLVFDLGWSSSSSGFSGKSGAQRATLDRSYIDEEYIDRLRGWEHSNDPCALSARYRHVETLATGGIEKWDECDGSNNDEAEVLLPTAYRSTGVAVCLSSDETKIKGFALLGRYPECIVDQSGTHAGMSCAGGGTGIIEGVERANCPGSPNGYDGDWEPYAECPLGYVATGIEINHREGGGDRRMISGLQMHCNLLLD